MVPCICGITKAINGVLASDNVRDTQTLFQTLGHIFFKAKDTVLREHQTDSVYFVPCKDHELTCIYIIDSVHVYIGQTKCQFGMHLKEQQKTGFLCKKENSSLSHMFGKSTMQLGGIIILKLLPPTNGTIIAFFGSPH